MVASTIVPVVIRTPCACRCRFTCPRICSPSWCSSSKCRNLHTVVSSEMNHFSIFAHGDKFNVDEFLARSALRPDYVWRRGDQRSYACVESKHETSGVEFVLGNGWEVPFQEQEDIALAYLEAHRDELRMLSQFPGVETFILGLQYICKLHEGLLGLCAGPSSQLMWHALDIGVLPNYYVSFQYPAKPEREPYSYFCLAGVFDPDEITRRVGVKPTEIARAGDSIGSTQIKRKNSLWALHSRLQPSGDVDQHVRDVLDQLDTNRLAFEELSRELGGIIVIVGFSRDYAPAVSLEQDVVGRLAQYALRVDMEPNCR